MQAQGFKVSEASHFTRLSARLRLLCNLTRLPWFYDYL